MKKLLLFSLMVLLLGACTSTEKTDSMDKISRANTEGSWWQEAGEIDSEYWWIHPGYEEDANNDEYDDYSD